MLRGDTTRKPAIISRAKTLFLFIFVACLAAFVSARSWGWLQGTDFPHFYCAARMVAQGHGHQLYDAALQRQYQARYAGRVGPLYNHPPFETALYLAVSWLPLRYAYLLWFFANIAFLAAGANRLATAIPLRDDWHTLLAASLTFVPVLLCLLQGQDSVLLLLLVIFAFAALRQERGFASGCWLGLGLFKFQLVLPLALVLLLSRGRGAFAKGFGLLALALAGLSAAISGWQVFLDYPQFLLRYPEQPLAGIFPQAMANFRGLIYLFLGRAAAAWAIAAASIVCTAALIKTLLVWRRVRLNVSRDPTSHAHDLFDVAFANTVLFALLVSYHLNPHDLSLLFLPILLLYTRLRQTPRWGTRPVNWITFGVLLILFLPPLHLWALRMGAYSAVGIPLLALFLMAGAPTVSAGKA